VEEAPEGSLVTVWLASADHPWIRTWVDQFLTRWQHTRPHADGNQLRQQGLPPGPEYGHILDSLRAGWLDGKITSEAEEHEALVGLLKEIKGSG
jgi:tRNA nucleotidyltransferase (CCA-adding enzyme)